MALSQSAVIKDPEAFRNEVRHFFAHDYPRAVLDKDGLDGLSVQAVARAMGVTAPSLYYHFKDKDELLQLGSGPIKYAFEV
jgi:AcrR family transcriptional regulator